MNMGIIGLFYLGVKGKFSIEIGGRISEISKARKDETANVKIFRLTMAF
jgi:hypothetical protein